MKQGKLYILFVEREGEKFQVMQGIDDADTIKRFCGSYSFIDTGNSYLNPMWSDVKITPVIWKVLVHETDYRKYEKLS